MNKKSGKKRISIALATYNGERYIKALLDSINAQTLLPDEIVVSDDNSSDNTIAIINAFARQVGFRVVVLENPHNIGVFKNFINAFEHCSYELIAYCDQDDVWNEDKLEVCSSSFDERTSLVIHRSRVVAEDLSDMGFSIPAIAEKTRWTAPVYGDLIVGHGHQMMFIKSVVDLMKLIKIYDINNTLSSFDLLIGYVSGMIGDINIINEELMLFRRHASSTSQLGKNIQQGLITNKVLADRARVNSFSSYSKAILSCVASSNEISEVIVENYLENLKDRTAIYSLCSSIYTNERCFLRIKSLADLLSLYWMKPLKPNYPAIKLSKFLIYFTISIFSMDRVLLLLKMMKK